MHISRSRDISEPRGATPRGLAVQHSLAELSRVPRPHVPFDRGAKHGPDHRAVLTPFPLGRLTPRRCLVQNRRRVGG